MKPVVDTPAMITATPNLPITVTSQRAIYCVTCSALCRPFPLLFPPVPTVERRNRKKELEQKSKNNTEEEYYLPSPQYKPYSSVSKKKDTMAPALTDTLVPAPEKKPEEEREQKIEVDTKDTADMESETDCDSDNTVDILRAELI